MFTLGILLGLYSYFIFFLGVFGLLYKPWIIFFSLVYWFVVILWQRRQLISFFKSVFLPLKKQSNLFWLLLILFILQVLINLIGVLSPELAFDALWYHLTLPKLFLENHTISYIPGGLLYYSVMPKLGEMFYLTALSFGNEIVAKFIHFSFGILIAVIIYQFTRQFFSSLIALLAVVIFYSNLVVAWESTTAYIDLIRTFYEILALWAFVNWWRLENKKLLFLSALLLGFAITTKLLAFSSLVIFLILIAYRYIIIKRSHLENSAFTIQIFWKKLLITSFHYLAIALLIPLPWFIFSFISTGNPFYPFFSSLYVINHEPFSLIIFINDLWNVLSQAADPISPVYLIFLPLIFITFSKLKTEFKLLICYSGLSLIFWYFTPRTGGGRFLLPYVPAFSIVCAGIYAVILKKSREEYRYISYILISVIIFVSIITIGYRLAASYKYVPVLIGQQSRHEFLTNNLNFAFADFYDTDNYFKTHITQNDKVLLYGFHNLYYVDFPYVHESWIKKDDTFTYIATQRALLPKRFSDWELIYTNKKTMVNLYKPPKDQCNLVCSF